MPFYHHYQCSFKLSFCHLEILKKILIFSKISHWISIFSIITIYSYHKWIPDGLKIVPYLFWVISPILDSVLWIINNFEQDIKCYCQVLHSVILINLPLLVKLGLNDVFVGVGVLQTPTLRHQAKSLKYGIPIAIKASKQTNKPYDIFINSRCCCLASFVGIQNGGCKRS